MSNRLFKRVPSLVSRPLFKSVQLSAPAVCPSPPPSAREIASGTTKLLSVQETANRIGMSKGWVRSHFEKIEGVVIILSPPKAGVQQYRKILIPEAVLEHEIRQFIVKRAGRTPTPSGLESH